MAARSGRYAVNLEDVGAHRAFADVYLLSLPDAISAGHRAAAADGYAWAVALHGRVVGLAGLQDVADAWQAWLSIPTNIHPGLWGQAMEAVRQTFLARRPDRRPLVVKSREESQVVAQMRTHYPDVEVRVEGRLLVFVLEPDEPEKRPELPTPAMYPAAGVGGARQIPTELLAALRPSDAASSWRAVTRSATPRVGLDLVLEVLGTMPRAARWSARVGHAADIASAISVTAGCGGEELELRVGPGLALPRVSIGAELRRVAFALADDAALDVEIRGLAGFAATGGRKVDLAVRGGPARGPEQGPEQVRLRTTAPSMITVPVRWEFAGADGERHKTPMGFLYASGGFDGRALAAP